MKEILSLIDHTILNADATKEMVKSICEEAIEYNFKAVCVNPCHIKYCKELLEGTKISLASVIGFPLGANTSHVKSFETKNAIDNGANEIDMVINIGALKSKDYDIVLEDIKEVVNAAKDKALVKVIIETSLLNNDEKRKACELAMEAGADFVKTSTGFSTSGASIDDIRLMREVVGDKLGIKASGGIRDLETACAMVNAGATRLGASAGVKIAKEL